jgi:hypothetical protein
VHVHHIALRTADVPRLVAFYREVVGLALDETARGRSTGSVWLLADRTLVMVEPRGPGEPDVGGGSMDLVAFAIEPADRAAFSARLARAGVAVEQETAFTLYFRDPDGRRVGVSHFPHPR